MGNPIDNERVRALERVIARLQTRAFDDLVMIEHVLDAFDQRDFELRLADVAGQFEIKTERHLRLVREGDD
jgi:hypothetical protein